MSCTYPECWCLGATDAHRPCRQQRLYTCRTIGCDLPRAEEWHLLCPRCWDVLAPSTQNRVLVEYRKRQGSAEHFQACSDARREATEALND